MLYQKDVRSKVKGIHLLKRKVCCTKKRSDQFIWEFLNKICEKKKKKKKRKKEKEKKRKKEKKEKRKKKDLRELPFVWFTF